MINTSPKEIPKNLTETPTLPQPPISATLPFPHSSVLSQHPQLPINSCQCRPIKGRDIAAAAGGSSGGSSRSGGGSAAWRRQHSAAVAAVAAAAAAAAAAVAAAVVVAAAVAAVAVAA